MKHMIFAGLAKTIFNGKGLIICGLVCSLICAGGCARDDNKYIVNDANNIILRMAESQSASYPSTRGDEQFARLVDQKSQGRIQVKIYHSGQLGEEASVIEQVHFGGLDLARVDLAALSQYAPEIAAMTLPYIFDSAEQMWAVIEGPYGQTVQETLQKEKITCLCWYEGGARNFYNSRRPVDDLDDLSGLKLSIPYAQDVMDAYSYLGISLIPTLSGDRYSALKEGSIDGVEENVIIYFNSKYYEVCKYMTLDAHSYLPELIIASRTTLMQLPQSDQELIQEAARESAVFQRKLWAEAEQDVLEALKKLDVSLSVLDNNSREAFLKEATSLYDVMNLDHYEILVQAIADLSIQ